MTWINDLIAVYDRNQKWIGKFKLVRAGNPAKKIPEKNALLLPISHTTVKAQYEVVVNKEGELVEADFLGKKGELTIIPATIDANSRTRKLVPYPVHDKFQYVARDYQKYVPLKATQNEAYHGYLQQLETLVATSDGQIFQPVFEYLKHHDLIHDLIEQGTFAAAGIQNRQPEKKDLAGFIRFRIAGEKAFWEDPAAFDKWDRYYQNLLNEEEPHGISYATGMSDQVLTIHHPRAIRYPGDGAKLISSNDSDNYTYRGRFWTPEEVVGLSYRDSQKAHLALKWLIELQGLNLDGRIFLVWGVGVKKIITMNQFYAGFGEIKGLDENRPNTDMDLAMQFRKTFWQGNEIQPHGQVYLMELDAATPGRLGILNYRSMDVQTYFNRIIAWYEGMRLTRYYKQADHAWNPSLKQLIEATYGTKGSDKILKNALSRVIQAIFDGQALPKDMQRQLYVRASHPTSFKADDSPNWQTVCRTTAAVWKHKAKGRFKMGLDRQETDRSYLFGRLLAVADVVEQGVLDAKEKEGGHTSADHMRGSKRRLTNARRYMSTFSQRPVTTWKHIYQQLQKAYLPQSKFQFKAQKEFDQIMELLDSDEYVDQPLDGTFLLGFSHQRNAWFKKATENEEEK